MDSIKILKKLVTFRTTADRTAELKRANAFIVSLLRPHGIWTQELIMPGVGRPVLYACTQKTKRPAVLLVPHLDVVEGADAQFVPRTKGDWLYARGASDCKGNVTVCIQALRALAGSGKSVGVFFTSDEEIGGASTGHLLSRGFCGKRTIVLDSDCAIVFRQKGILNVKVTVTGKSTHGSSPWAGENANEKLLLVYSRIKKLFPDTTPRDRWKRTVNLGLMQGGDVINKVPDHAEMRLNIRLTEKDDPRRLIAAIKKVPGAARVEQLGLKPFFRIDARAGHVREFQRTMEKALGKDLPLVSMHGATDVHNFAGYRTQLIVTGMGNGLQAHGAQEAVHMPSVIRFEKALIAYLQSTL
jgi:succinyl-diaminopimelate desuccinylase